LTISRCIPCILSGFLAVASSTTTAAQERLLEKSAAAGVRDGAGMFSEEAIRQAGESLRAVARESGVVAVVETVANLGGDEVDQAAIKVAKRSAIRGLFVLVAKKEMKIEVLASRQFHDAFPRDELHKVRTAFTNGFREKEFDRGLREGVAAIAKAAALARTEKKLPVEESKPEDAGRAATAEVVRPASALIVRNQVKLTLEGARAILDGAEKKAAAMNLKANIAVVDDGGHLLSFVRMNGGRPASVATAITKAVSAATFRQSSGPIPIGATAHDPILNISLQNAAAAGGSKITSLRGGEPVKVDDQVIGGVGVGGGTGEQDAEIARAGIEAFLEQLASPDQPGVDERKP